jgi:signal recognition particle subunit SRP54
MIPGASKAMKDVEIEDDALNTLRRLFTSMTPIERSKPSVIDVKREKQNCERFWN